MKFLAVCVLSIFTFLCSVDAQVNPNQVYVSGYFRKDGSFVAGHYKTVQNETNRDNFTTRPNVNPYTGKPGYIEPDTKSTYQSSPYTGYSIPASSVRTPGYPSVNTYYQASPCPSTYSPSTGTVYTGSRGGQYYINSSGNKTYIKR
ncbi:hypothetical protein [Arcticibacter sp. MXS-1]|uniref:hypothetical protein n=1 Tax=Arcticibacter sp. MXS-1 TaxID=3341726 RepID=UPI0035A99903